MFEFAKLPDNSIFHNKNTIFLSAFSSCMDFRFRKYLIWEVVKESTPGIEILTRNITLLTNYLYNCHVSYYMKNGLFLVSLATW